jgi:hypothetical protein
VPPFPLPPLVHAAAAVAIRPQTIRRRFIVTARCMLCAAAPARADSALLSRRLRHACRGRPRRRWRRPAQTRAADLPFALSAQRCRVHRRRASAVR